MSKYWQAEKSLGGNPILRLAIIIAVLIVFVGVAVVPTTLDSFAFSVNQSVPMTFGIWWQYAGPGILVAAILSLILILLYAFESRSMLRRAQESADAQS